jgi:hypothetical protein
MNTWKRYDLLKQSISHYSSCAGLKSIHIVWSEPNPPSDSLSKFLNHVVESKTKGLKKIKLSFDINKEDSLNNRFKEISGLKTDAVFSIDDDVIFPCSSVEFAFKVWQSAPDAMVGFVPRAHWVDKSVWLLEDLAFHILFCPSLSSLQLVHMTIMFGFDISKLHNTHQAQLCMEDYVCVRTYN